MDTGQCCAQVPLSRACNGWRLIVAMFYVSFVLGLSSIVSSLACVLRGVGIVQGAVSTISGAVSSGDRASIVNAGRLRKGPMLLLTAALM